MRNYSFKRGDMPMWSEASPFYDYANLGSKKPSGVSDG